MFVKVQVALMKKRTILVFVGGIVLLLVVTFLYFYVSGRTVANLFSEFENYEVTINRSSSIGVIDSETVLTSTQKEMLKNLFRETPFRRVIAAVVYTADTARYEIRINGTHETQNGDIITGDIFYAESTGGEYLLISGEYSVSGKHLKIYNSQWNKRIDEIIAQSDKN